MAKTILHKNGGVKIVDGEDRIKLLKSLGWNEDGESVSQKNDDADERATLVEEAKALGLKVHHMAGIDKIKAMIEEAKKAD